VHNGTMQTSTCGVGHVLAASITHASASSIMHDEWCNAGSLTSAAPVTTTKRVAGTCRSGMRVDEEGASCAVAACQRRGRLLLQMCTVSLQRLEHQGTVPGALGA
jgi:hypothetical protein